MQRSGGSQTKAWPVDNALPQFLADFCALRVDKIIFEKSLWEATILMTRRKYSFSFFVSFELCSCHVIWLAMLYLYDTALKNHFAWGLHGVKLKLQAKPVLPLYGSPAHCDIEHCVDR